MQGPLENPVANAAQSPARGPVKSVEIGRRIEKKLGLKGDEQVRITQDTRGPIQFSIATKHSGELKDFFSDIPGYKENIHLKNLEVKGRFTVMTMESFFRLRLFAELFLNGEDKDGALIVADLVDKLTGVDAKYNEREYFQELFENFNWEPHIFKMLHAESFVCHHVRKLVQAHTIYYLQKNAAHFKPEKSSIFRIDNLKAKNNGDLECVIEVVPQDCLEAARSLAVEGLQVCVLNMANQHYVGGGYGHGAGAQEEDLCRRTDLLKSLDPNLYQGTEGFGEFSVLYTKGVTVFRQGQAAGYKIDSPENWFKVNMVSAAAYNLGSSRSRSYIDQDSQEYINGMKRKIRGQLRAAKANHDDALVLSAFGCGAFGNDSNRVAQFYLDVLSEQEFHNAFAYVQFAIIPNPSQTNNDNFTNFQRVFAGKGLRPEDLVVEVVEEDNGLGM